MGVLPPQLLERAVALRPGVPKRCCTMIETLVPCLPGDLGRESSIYPKTYVTPFTLMTTSEPLLEGRTRRVLILPSKTPTPISHPNPLQTGQQQTTGLPPSIIFTWGLGLCKADSRGTSFPACLCYQRQQENRLCDGRFEPSLLLTPSTVPSSV